jgi:tripartite-type tricarboxylate transporter receptor subunit TctC
MINTYCSTSFFFRLLGLSVLLNVLLVGFATQANAAYPEKTISLVSPFQPGGASDVLARTIVKQLSDPLASQLLLKTNLALAGILGLIMWLGLNPMDIHYL